jgi:hypothetical protein
MAGDAAETPIAASPLRKALTHSLAFWALAVPLWVLVGAALDHRFALDFRRAFLPAAHAVLHGASPYSAIGSRALAEGTAFLYPPVGAYLLAPFTVLPPVVAEVLAVLLAAATIPATLLLLGVRDWRCYAVSFIWWPAIIGIQTANFTLPMLLGLAVAWRFRNRTLVVAVALGAVVALKLFFWPLLVWFVATRRYRTAALATLTSLALVLIPWAGIGFAGLRGYPHLLSTISNHEGPRSYSLAALIHAAVSNWTVAIGVATIVGLAILGVSIYAGRRGRDRDAFALAIVSVLGLTPLLEMHYLAALLVIVALYRPRFGLAWFVPLLIWGLPATVAGSAFQVAFVLLVVAATICLALSDWRPRGLGRMLRLEAV